MQVKLENLWHFYYLRCHVQTKPNYSTLISFSHYRVVIEIFFNGKLCVLQDIYNIVTVNNVIIMLMTR